MDLNTSDAYYAYYNRVNRLGQSSSQAAESVQRDYGLTYAQMDLIVRAEAIAGEDS